MCVFFGGEACYVPVSAGPVFFLFFFLVCRYSGYCGCVFPQSYKDCSADEDGGGVFGHDVNTLAVLFYFSVYFVCIQFRP